MYPNREIFTDRELALDLRCLMGVLAQRHASHCSLDDYFDAYAIRAALPMPATLLMAEDDPIIPAREFRQLALPGQATLDIASVGGHCGFVSNWTLHS